MRWKRLAAITALAIGPACAGDEDTNSSRRPLLEDEDAATGRPPTPITGMTTYDRSAAVPGFAVDISLGGPTGEDVVLDWSGDSYYGEEVSYGDVTIYRSSDPVALRDLDPDAPLPASVTATDLSGVGSWADVGAASRTVQTPHYYYRVAQRTGGGGGGGGNDGDGAAAYLRADGYAPWGQTVNEQAMDMQFGAGAWSDLRFETVDVDSLFSSQYEFIYLEGGDSNASELQLFISNNIVAIEEWVDNGGTLFLNSAPNEGGSQAWGFGGVTLNYYDFPTDPGHAVDPSHPIWNGPFTPTATSFTGNYYAHATVSGPGLIPHILDADGGNPNLAELQWGLGHVMFGGLTTSNFWSPANEALNLRANIIDYLVEGAITVPQVQLSTMVMKTTTVTAPGYNRFGLCMLDGPATASEAFAELGAGVLGIHTWDADAQNYLSWTPGSPDFALPYGSAVVAQLDGSAQPYHSLVGVVPTDEALAVSGEPGYNWGTLPVFYDGPTSTEYWLTVAGYWGIGVRHNDTQTEQWDWNDPGYEAFEMEPCGGYNFYLPNNACAGNEDCGEGQFCYFVEPAACGDVAAGLCLPEPLGCEGAPESPVCGCDGQTYANECLAQAAGVARRSAGECPVVAACGDGNIDEGEQCDGGNLGENTCGTQGFDGGELGCTADCTFDTSGCTTGGGACEGDPVANALAACQAEYTYCDVVDGGVVGHNGAGTGSNCGTPEHQWRWYCTETTEDNFANYNCSPCTVGEILGAHDPCSCDPGTSPVLGSFCDGEPAQAYCGDGNIDAGEQCDGGNLGEASCQSEGFTGGTLGCTADCTFDTGACTNGGGGAACEGGDALALALAACQAEYTYCDVVDGGVVGHNGAGTGSNCGTPEHEWRWYCTETTADNFGNYNCSPCTAGEILGAHDPCSCDPGTSPVLGSFCDAGAPPDAGACEGGTDALTGIDWVVCAADANEAWVSHADPGGGQLHAEQICNQLGYSDLGQFGGTCGNVCGYCEGATSCESPGNQTYDGAGACGADANGQILCYTVQWQCTNGAAPT